MWHWNVALYVECGILCVNVECGIIYEMLHYMCKHIMWYYMWNVTLYMECGIICVNVECGIILQEPSEKIQHFSYLLVTN